MFSRIDHILVHQKCLNQFKRIEIISSLFSDYNGKKLEINQKKKTREKKNTWRLNNMLLKSKWVNNEIKEEIRKYLETNNNENKTLQNLWDTAKAVLRGKFIVIQAFFKKKEKPQIKKPNLPLKRIRKRRTNKTQSSQKRK